MNPNEVCPCVCVSSERERESERVSVRVRLWSCAQAVIVCTFVFEYIFSCHMIHMMTSESASSTNDGSGLGCLATGQFTWCTVFSEGGAIEDNVRRVYVGIAKTLIETLS